MTKKASFRVISTLLCMLFVLSFMLVGCGQQSSSENSSKSSTSGQDNSAKEPILIGVPAPLSGGVAELGERLKNGMEMAVDEINAKGGVRGGHPLKLVFGDHEAKAENAITVTQQLIDDSKVIMLAGDVTSATVTNTARVAQQNQIPYIVTTGSADAITQQGYDWVFRINQPTSEMNNAALDFISQVAKPKTMALIYDNSAYGQASFTSFKAWAPTQNIEIVNAASFQSGSADFRPILLKLKSLNPDLIYFASAAVGDASLFMRTAKEVDVNPKLFMGSSGGMSNPDIIKSAGAAVEYATANTVFWPTPAIPGSVEFADNYQKKFGKMIQGTEAEGYSGIYVAADALNRAASLKSEDIKKALAETNMQTVFGKVKFENYGKFINQNRTPSVLLQVIKGEMQAIYPPEIKGADYVYPVPAWNKR